VTIYKTNEDGEITIIFDSRWEHPETLGYKPEDPEYKMLRKLWEEATKESDSEVEASNENAEVLVQTD